MSRIISSISFRLPPNEKRLSLHSPCRSILRRSFCWFLSDEEPSTDLPVPPDSCDRILTWASHDGKTHCLLDVILVLTQAKGRNLPRYQDEACDFLREVKPLSRRCQHDQACRQKNCLGQSCDSSSHDPTCSLASRWALYCSLMT